MADEPYARIAQLEAEVAALRGREATLTHEVERLRPALTEALEQETATAEILRVIASSPTDLQKVLDAIVASLQRVLDADLRVRQETTSRFGSGDLDGRLGGG
jgi:hypothetical protein